VKVLSEQKVEKKGVFQFIREVRTELNKVSWPTNKELVSYTGVVGLAVIIVCALIWICDTAFAKLFRLILG
jgi:preprotein translocase subunit SecE